MSHGSLIIHAVTVKVKVNRRSRLFVKDPVTMVTETEQNCFADEK